MEKNTIVATWSWMVVTILIELLAAPYLSSAKWQVRGGVESLVALSGVVPLILFYMGLKDEHRGLKMFVVVALFFCVDLLLIWSASLAH